MGLFGKRSSNASTISTGGAQLSPKLQSPSTKSSATTPETPSFPTKPLTQLPPPPNPQSDPEGYLTSLQAVRERSQLVFERVRQGKGSCFTLDPNKFDDVIRYVVGIIKVNPPH
jgi:Protein of unknown function (DUF1688)